MREFHRHDDLELNVVLDDQKCADERGADLLVAKA